jgi:hypothetical protein
MKFTSNVMKYAHKVNYKNPAVTWDSGCIGEFENNGMVVPLLKRVSSAGE